MTDEERKDEKAEVNAAVTLFPAVSNVEITLNNQDSSNKVDDEVLTHDTQSFNGVETGNSDVPAQAFVPVESSASGSQEVGGAKNRKRGRPRKTVEVIESSKDHADGGRLPVNEEIVNNKAQDLVPSSAEQAAQATSSFDRVNAFLQDFDGPTCTIDSTSENMPSISSNDRDKNYNMNEHVRHPMFLTAHGKLQQRQQPSLSNFQFANTLAQSGPSVPDLSHVVPPFFDNKTPTNDKNTNNIRATGEGGYCDYQKVYNHQHLIQKIANECQPCHPTEKRKRKKAKEPTDSEADTDELLGDAPEGDDTNTTESRELFRNRHVLFTRMTVRELRAFLNETDGIESAESPFASTQAVPVRRPQKKRRNHSDPMLRERPSFPFLLVQIGEFQGHLQSNVNPHPQQRGRPNSICLNPAQKRMIYEFTVMNREGALCYTVWNVEFHHIEAMHFTKELVYFRLNHPAQLNACFRGNVPDPSYDVTGGQRPNVLLHYFRLQCDSSRLRETLMRYDRTHFDGRLLSYKEFFKQVFLTQQHQLCMQAQLHNQQHGTPVQGVPPSFPYAPPSHGPVQQNLYSGTQPPPGQAHIVAPSAQSFYAQSQYNMQQCEGRQPVNVPLFGYSQPDGYGFPIQNNEQMQQHHQRQMQQGYDTQQSNSLERRNSDYFPGAMDSQISMRRDSEYLMGGLSASQYAMPQPQGMDSNSGYPPHPQVQQHGNVQQQQHQFIYQNSAPHFAESMYVPSQPQVPLNVPPSLSFTTQSVNIHPAHDAHLYGQPLHDHRTREAQNDSRNDDCNSVAEIQNKPDLASNASSHHSVIVKDETPADHHENPYSDHNEDTQPAIGALAMQAAAETFQMLHTGDIRSANKGLADVDNMRGDDSESSGSGRFQDLEDEPLSPSKEEIIKQEASKQVIKIESNEHDSIHQGESGDGDNNHHQIPDDDLNGWSNVDDDADLRAFMEM